MNISPAYDPAAARPRRNTLSLFQRPLIGPAQQVQKHDLRRDLDTYRQNLARAMDRWAPLVETMDRRPLRGVASLILESYAVQRVEDLKGAGLAKDDAETRLRQELPFIVNVIQHLAPLEEMISMQPMLKSSAFIFYSEEGEMRQTPVKALTRLLRGTWKPDVLAALNASGDATARSVAYQIQREIISRICAHAHITEVERASAMPSAILDTISALWGICPQSRPWLIISEAMAESVAALVPHFRRAPDGERYGMSMLGHLATPQEDEHGLPREDQVWGKVFLDPALEANTAVVGVKGESMTDSGYVYSPFLVALPSDPELQGSIRTRGAHKLINPDFFRVLQLQEAAAIEIEV